LVIHAREATQDVLDSIQLRNFRNGFMLHFFSGTLHDAKRAVEMGGYVSIPPVRSKDRTAAIGALGLEHLLVESDSPYVGRTPEATMDSVAYIAEVKKVDKETVIERTSQNARAFFKIK
jgi:TatD DNase family protein